MSRTAIILALLASNALLIEPTWHANGAAFIWNASASVPTGLYRLVPPAPVEVGDLVVATPPEPLAGFLATRGYLPHGVRLMKHVLALAGAEVCRVATTILVDGHAVGTALERDSRDRPLPAWRGCRTLSQN